MKKKVQTQQHWKTLPNFCPVYFSILFFLYSPIPSHVLYFTLAELFISQIYHTISHIWVFVSVSRVLSICLLENSYSSPKVRFRCSVLYAKHSRFSWVELVAWYSMFFCLFFCCSLSHCFIIICLHAYLSCFNTSVEKGYGKARFLQRYLLNIAAIKTLCI